MTDNPLPPLNDRLNDIRARYAAASKGLSHDNLLWISLLDTDVQQFLLIRELLRGFVPESELSTSTLGLTGQHNQIDEGLIEEFVNKISNSLDGLSFAIGELAEATGDQN